VLTVLFLGCSPNKPMQGQVSCPFISSEQRNRSWPCWFRCYLRLDMTVYDLVSQTEHRSLLWTEKETFVCAWGLLLARKWHFQLLVSSGELSVRKSASDCQSFTQSVLDCQLFIYKTFILCLCRGVNSLSLYYFVSKKAFSSVWLLV
jgi:hypothetical protein